jgi:hypothetical protein
MKILDHYSDEFDTTVVTRTDDGVVTVATYPHDPDMLYLDGEPNTVLMLGPAEARWLRDILDPVVGD